MSNKKKYKKWKQITEPDPELTIEEAKNDSGYTCYLLQSISKPGRTYIGCTNDPIRRLRQHNGEIQGGAKKTRYARPWKMICYVSGFPNRRMALQYEYVNNHPLTKRWGVNGRIKTLTETLYRDKWMPQCPDVSHINFIFHWLELGYCLSCKRLNCKEIYNE